MNSPGEPREESLERVREYAEGRISAADLSHYLDASLAGLELYPPEPVMDIGQAAGQILERRPEAAVAAALQLISSDQRVTRAVAAILVSRLARFNPGLWAGVIRHLAADADWEVRSFAARVYDSREGYSGAIEFHTDWVFDEIAGWVRDANYLLRHAATEAMLGYVRAAPDAIPRVLAALEPLLNDAAEYVRRGHVIALRTMGRERPPAVLDYIEQHLPPASEELRETFQLVLEHRFAGADPARRQRLLDQLAAPPREAPRGPGRDA